MMPRKHSQWKFGLVLGIGALIALALCVQCVRTYLYTDAVLVPQEAGHEAVRQVGLLSASARSAGISEPRNLGPAIERAMESSSDRVLWMRVLDLQNNVLAQGGHPEGTARIPPRWWERVQNHDKVGSLIDTSEGKAFVVMLPLRMPRPPHPSEGEGGADRQYGVAEASRGTQPGSHEGSAGDRRSGNVLEVAISLKAVASAFEGLRQNLIVGLIAAIALLVSLAVIGLRAPHYVRGKYLESELQLAKRVQSDLQPKPHSVSPHLEFAASAVAADHIGGDFYDIFEEKSGKVAIVLGDVSGKGVPAALLVSVLHGAIRSSTATQHEMACERINRMLCERTACERFATLFWGVFDPAKSILRYVNAGHVAPILVRQDSNAVERLREGGPVLGLLPSARYSAGETKIEAGDRLILYSDGISEATNDHDEEFGEARIADIVSKGPDSSPERVCDRIVGQVNAFARFGVPQDDRTLMVIKVPQSGARRRDRRPAEAGIAVLA
jgi:Stage II sporulation protein E (SpoIIE)